MPASDKEAESFRGLRPTHEHFGSHGCGRRSSLCRSWFHWSRTSSIRERYKEVDSESGDLWRIQIRSLCSISIVSLQGGSRGSRAEVLELSTVDGDRRLGFLITTAGCRRVAVKMEFTDVYRTVRTVTMSRTPSRSRLTRWRSMLTDGDSRLISVLPVVSEDVMCRACSLSARCCRSWFAVRILLLVLQRGWISA